MSSISDTVLKTLSQSPSPLSVRTIARKTNISKKNVKAIMNEHKRKGNVVSVEPYKIGSGKSYGSIFCTKDNIQYA